MAGLYIHIPFCASKCDYCDFYSVMNPNPDTHRRLLMAIAAEARMRSSELDEQVDTVYIGGGTPTMVDSLLLTELLEQLHECFTIAAEAEITIEANPGDVSAYDYGLLVRAGLNRVSIGAQSFDPTLLRQLSRRHTPTQTREMVQQARAAGIHNLSLDLIFGIPSEQPHQLQHDLEQIVELQPQHISAYHLMYEPGTLLTHRLMRGEVAEIDEELSREMLTQVHQHLTQAGYEHYEISNYALPGYRSRHNSAYWAGTPYIGLGPSAHSYTPPLRSWNASSIARYTRDLLSPTPMLHRTQEVITPEMELMEIVLTRMRTIEGIDMVELAQRFGEQSATTLLRRAEPFIQRGTLAYEAGRLHLTPEGILLSDGIIEALA